MIKVWTDAAEAGLLDRHRERGSTFAYLPGAPPTRAVSMTMPSRLESWSVPFGLLPIFEMNLPEGVLRERLRLAFAKATGTFDEFDLLSVVGRSQVGRIRYTGDKEHLHEDVPFQSVDEILQRRRGGDLFRYLLERFASFSGISGVQPKILVRDEKAFAEMAHTGQRLSQSYKGATHIVKLWPGPRADVDARLARPCDRRRRRRGGGTPGGRGVDGPWCELRAAIARWRAPLALQDPPVARACDVGRRSRHPGRRRGDGRYPAAWVRAWSAGSGWRAVASPVAGSWGRQVVLRGRAGIAVSLCSPRPDRPDGYGPVWSASVDDGATWSTAERMPPSDCEGSLIWTGDGRVYALVNGDDGYGLAVR